MGKSSDEVQDVSGLNLLKETVPQDNRRLINQIVDEIFEERRGVAEISSTSTCSSKPIDEKKPKLDRRLAYWQEVLEDRRRIQRKIQETVGKRPDEIMFNRMTTLDERNKKTVQTIMDYAYRLSPAAMVKRKTMKLKSFCHPETCMWAPELPETMPKAERDRCKFVEITGLPNHMKVELLGKLKEQGEERKSIWLHSQYLKQRIDQKRADLERVVEFYPDIDNLEVIGEGILPPREQKHDSEIRLTNEVAIKTISSDTSYVDRTVSESSIIEENIPEFAVKLNDQIYIKEDKPISKLVESGSFFLAEPYETVIRGVLYIENVGKCVLNFEWVNKFYYEKNGTFLKATQNEFQFNREPFRLFRGESRHVLVSFKPRTVGMYKEKWFLRVNPQMFCKKVEAICIKLRAQCKPPSDYVWKLKEEQRLVLEKSNLNMMRKFTHTMANLTPLVKPPERSCPYQRLLDDREIFEIENYGYKCDRLQDLELLKALYQRLKKPRDQKWDLKIDTLKSMILSLPKADERALVLDELLGIVQPMRGQSISLDDRLKDDKERAKTCFIHVKGLICSAIDNWEDILFSIETGLFRPILDNFNEEVQQMDLIGAEEMEEGEEGELGYKLDLYIRLMNAGDEAINRYITKKVRRSKAFRDAALIQTYTLLCNIVEDMVSIVEGTDLI